MQFFSFFYSQFPPKRPHSVRPPFDALSGLLFVIALVTIVATTHKYLLGVEFCNNVLIFRAAARHFLDGAPLYQPYPAEHADIFKYSPTFAALALPLAFLPVFWSAIAWNALNAGVFVAGALAAARVCSENLGDSGDDGAHRLSGKARTAAAMALGITAIELLTALQNFQSNALVAGLALWAFAATERRKPSQAACALALSFFVKIYGAAPAALIALYPSERRRFATVFPLALGVLGAAPLLFASPERLYGEYLAWFDVLRRDYASPNALSAMSVLSGVARAAFPWVETGTLLTLERATQYASVAAQAFPAAFLLLCSRLNPNDRAEDLATTALTAEFRLLTFCSTLVWVVIFNHKAESPTFIIAVAGVALWFVFGRRSAPFGARRIEIFALLAFIVVVSLSVTDFFSDEIRNRIFVPLRLKVLPCIGVWLYLVFASFRLARRICRLHYRR